jgi:hypothetical protein
VLLAKPLLNPSEAHLGLAARSSLGGVERSGT